MRFIGILLTCLVLFNHPGFAQDQDPSDFGIIGGGGIVAWMSLTGLEPLNNLLSLNGFAAFSDGFPTYGYWGHTGSLLGWQIGGMGIHGDMTTRQGNQLARLDIDYSGVTLDYGLLAADRYTLSVGAMMGGGQTQLSLLFDQPSSFEEAIVNPSTSELKREFFLARPHLSIGFNLLGFYLQLSGAYLLTFPGDWQQQDIDFPGPPANFNGWSLEMLISFGWGYPNSVPKPNDSPSGHEGD